jgi:hypothetical protein
MLLFLSSITFAGAAVIDFDLSPSGTSAAVGLQPANQAPAAAASVGSGNSISGGITFDTTTSTLSFAMGYGSAAGFTNLTGAATSAHIHGSAGVGANAAVLFDLASVHFPASDPSQGGLIYGSVIYTPAQAADLMAGRNYVNIHTASYPNGELRGQLIRVNTAPEVIRQSDANIDCSVPVTFSATVSDNDGDAVEVTWILNGVAVETDNIAAGGPPSTGVVSYTVKLVNRVNTLGVIAKDSHGNVTSGISTYTVVDTIAPSIVAVTTNPKVLWPANHKFVPVRVNARVIDDCGPTTWKILSVRSNQTVDSKGSDRTSPDWKITDDHTVLLRAERSGKGGSRVYVITVQATDGAGNRSAPATARVVVPHDRRDN